MIVLTAAIMDLCHRGHLNLLKRMRELAGDGEVIVVLHSDQACFDIKGKFPIQSLEHRKNNVLATRLVDNVLTVDSVDPGEAFKTVINHYGAEDMVFMRGDDNFDYPGKYVIDDHKIPTVFEPYTQGVSSTKLREELV